MMILRSARPSPFGRKVAIAAAMLGLSDLIETVATDTNNPDDPVRHDNPLGKIPALILEDQVPIFDSRVIIEYLDQRAGGNRLIPVDPQARIAAFTLAALADGIIDASILRIYEIRFREPETHNAKWLAHQEGKVLRGLAFFAAKLPTGQRDIVHIGLACALGYLDLRFEGGWRKDYPQLVTWLDAFAADVPAFEATRVVA
jgi:glutathione S-transferase